jgi:hypothetical protein
MKPEVNGQDTYRVSSSGALAKKIKAMFEIAIEAGQEAGFFQGLERIHKKSENDPGKFGEPLYHLKNLNLEMRIGVIYPFTVTYGVNYSARTVFISKLTMSL